MRRLINGFRFSEDTFNAIKRKCRQDAVKRKRHGFVSDEAKRPKRSRALRMQRYNDVCTCFFISLCNMSPDDE